jgi:hypothetical protein
MYAALDTEAPATDEDAYTEAEGAPTTDESVI